MQAEDGTVEIVVIQVNVIPVRPQDDMRVVAGAAINTVNQYMITMKPQEIASMLRGMAYALEATG